MVVTIEYQTETGEWKPATDRTWATRRGAQHWLDSTWGGARVRFDHGHVRVTGVEERRRPYRGLDPQGWVHVGDIFHHSWGYDMTFNDFYEVTAVSRTGKTCTVRPIATIVEGDPNRPGGAYARPQLTGDDRWAGEPMPRKRITVSPGNGHPRASIPMGLRGDCALLMEPEDYVRGFYENHLD